MDTDDSAVYGVTAEEENSGNDTTELENMAEQTEFKIEKDRETADLLSLENINNVEEGTEVTVNENGVTEISDAEGLKTIATAPDGDYILTSNISTSAVKNGRRFRSLRELWTAPDIQLQIWQ